EGEKERPQPDDAQHKQADTAHGCPPFGPGIILRRGAGCQYSGGARPFTSREGGETLRQSLPHEESSLDASRLKADGTRWDRSELYTGPEDPRIEADLAEVRQRAEAFAQAYRGKVAGGELDGPALARALTEYEALSELEHRPSFYASLFFAADTQNPRAQ